MGRVIGIAEKLIRLGTGPSKQESASVAASSRLTEELKIRSWRAIAFGFSGSDSHARTLASSNRFPGDDVAFVFSHPVGVKTTQPAWRERNNPIAGPGVRPADSERHAAARQISGEAVLDNERRRGMARDRVGKFAVGRIVETEDPR